MILNYYINHDNTKLIREFFITLIRAHAGTAPGFCFKRQGRTFLVYSLLITPHFIP